jgi:hypothetical protein
MRLGKKNSNNLEQLDYLQDLNRLLFSNVVDQAAQKTEYYLAYYMGGGGKQASSSCKITGIHKSSSAPRRFLHGFNDTNEIGGDFHKSPMNYMVHQAWTSCATLAHHFFFPGNKYCC